MARCVKKLGLVVTTFLVCLLGILLPAASAAADITQPEEFYGNITINGVAAPVGTVIVAKISGVERGTFTTTEAGKYGGSGTFDPRLVVSGEEANIGQTITFWVNGSQADQTAIYEPGESKELNLTAWVYPLQASDTQITSALYYLRLTQAQQSNGSIGGFSVDAWVVMAIAAAGQDPDTWTAGGNSIVDYLRDNAGVNLDANKATDWERSILAIVAAGKNPRSFGGINYVDTLLAFYDDDSSQIGDDTLLNDDFWGILALVAIGESQTIIQASKDFIISNQNSDGGWGWTVGGDSDADNTAAAVSALISAGVSPGSPTIVNALTYLKSQQQNNGGFVSEGVTNSAVDAWVINAIADAGQSPVEDEWKESGNNPIGHLLSLQDTDGFFNYTAGVESQPVWMTAYAVIALMGKSWPKDTTSPTISNLTPSSETTVSTTSPTISASYSDAVSGINTATATIRVDGTNRTSSGTASASSISYAASGLTVGTHSVTVTVSDKAGNEATRSWVFQVVTGGGGGGSPGGSGFDQVEASLFGETTEIDIDSDGVIQETVEATSEDGNLTIIIEEDTVALDEVGEPLETLEVEVDESPPAPPANTQVIGLAYDFGPDGATFDPPLTLTFEYEGSEIPDDANEDDLVIAYWDEEAEEWVELDCTVDPVTNTITAEVSHFTVFAIIASQPSTLPSSPPALAPAAFSVSTLTVQPAEAKPKEPVTISISVANTGGTKGSHTVVLEINGLREAVQSVTVTAGRSEIVTFSVTRDEVGTYSVVVEDLNASFTVVAPLSQPPTAALPAPPAPPAPPVTTPTNWPLIGGIIVGVIVVGLLVFLLVRRAYYY